MEIPTMIVDVEGIASRLGSSVDQVTFPCDAAKRAQISVRTTHRLINENGVKFCSYSLFLILVRNPQIIRANHAKD
jgi:hypothetical protein